MRYRGSHYPNTSFSSLFNLLTDFLLHVLRDVVEVVHKYRVFTVGDFPDDLRQAALVKGLLLTVGAFSSQFPSGLCLSLSDQWNTDFTTGVCGCFHRKCRLSFFGSLIGYFHPA